MRLQLEALTQWIYAGRQAGVDSRGHGLRRQLVVDQDKKLAHAQGKSQTVLTDQVTHQTTRVAFRTAQSPDLQICAQEQGLSYDRSSAVPPTLLATATG